METLLQAREYKAQGQFHTERWEESSLTALRTDAGRKLADAIQATDPEQWWKPFEQSYRELRQASRGARNQDHS